MEKYNSSFINQFNQSLFVTGLLLPFQGSINNLKTPSNFKKQKDFR
jgi:hypothetical protein